MTPFPPFMQSWAGYDIANYDAKMNCPTLRGRGEGGHTYHDWKFEIIYVRRMYVIMMVVFSQTPEPNFMLISKHFLPTLRRIVSTLPAHARNVYKCLDVKSKHSNNFNDKWPPHDKFKDAQCWTDRDVDCAQRPEFLWYSHRARMPAKCERLTTIVLH